MSSSVFFKFKSQKEPSRVTFDGTGISVFELKRSIIDINKLGDGTDFNLAIYNEDNNEEYAEDTAIIPRSTSVTARRMPATAPGRGTAQRYVSGKMPIMEKNAGRIEKNKPTVQSATIKKIENAIPGVGGPQSEEDRIAAMFAASSDQWNQTQEQMATATPVYGNRPPGGGGFKKNTQPAPAHPPPTGYVCYRCGEKGHWIQQCPTNNDQTFDGRPRIKRTTGIPRSFLKTVEKPAATSDDEGGPTNVMVNADGEYVVAVADAASWEKHQQKAAKSSAQTTENTAESKELEELGLADPIDHKLLRDAVKTPCCSKVYSEECIQTALLDSDFVCPNCESKDIYLDHLIIDTETRQRVEDYKSGKLVAPVKAKSPSPPVKAKPLDGAVDGAVDTKVGTPKLAPTTAGSPNSKKRAAEEQLVPEIPRGPTSMLRGKSDEGSGRETSAGPESKTKSPQPANAILQVNGNNINDNNRQNQAQGQNFNNNNQMNMFPGQQPMMPNMPAFGFPDPSMMMNGMNPMMMGMPPMGMMDPMTMMQMGMQNMGGMDMSMMNGYGQMGMQNNGYMQQQHQQPHMQYNQNRNFNGNHIMKGNMNHQNGFQQQQQQLQQQQQYGQFGTFPNQQRTVFSEPFPSEEDSAYMRKPVNPHRHLKMKRPRPSDYKPLTER